MNFEGPIVAATALGPANPGDRPFTWRVHVDRSYRGALRGDIVIFMQFGDTEGPWPLAVGERLLLYVTPMLPDGADGLSVSGCGYSKWLTSAAKVELATKSELSFLARLGRRANDGRIFGAVEQYSSAMFFSGKPAVRFGGVRVTATDGKHFYSATTAADGTFDIGGLPPGSYRLSADLPGAQDVGSDDDRIVLQPHGCYESDIEVTGPAPVTRFEASSQPLRVALSGVASLGLSTTSASLPRWTGTPSA